MSSGNLSNDKRSETLSKEQIVHINTKESVTKGSQSLNSV